MSGFTKLFNSILHSTIWSEPDHVRIVWITMLAMADKYGDVHAAVPGLARMAGKSLEEVEDAIERFQKPDPYSRTSDHEGRRIQPIEGGWHLLNHGKYRELMSVEERKEYNRKKQAERRARLKMSQSVNDSQLPVRDNQQSKHIAEAEAEAEAEAGERDAFRALTGEEMTKTSGQRMAELMAKINSCDPRWEKRPAFTRQEMEDLRNNLQYFDDLTEDSWQLARDYLDAAVPKEGRFWQPDSRGRFIQSISDVFIHAERWQSL